MGSWPMVWSILPDVFSPDLLQGDFLDAVDRLEKQSSRDFAINILEGVIHKRDVAERLVDGDITLEQVITHSSKRKREWLLFQGLYPFEQSAASVITLQRVLDDPKVARGKLVELLTEFWTIVFRDTWLSLATQLETSLDQKSRMWASMSLQRFSDDVQLRVEIDLENGYIKALRGGARTMLATLTEVRIIPSAFNTNHYWHEYPVGEQTIVHFPYFDPMISVGIESVVRTRTNTELSPDIDPPFVFKALGDTTRYALAILLGQSPRTARELGVKLSLSKGTISHHVHILRQANLLIEIADGNSVVLSLNRKTLEQLSPQTVARLFRNEDCEITDQPQPLTSQ